MEKWMISLFVYVLVIILLSGCGEDVGIHEFDIKRLTRVDVQKVNADEEYGVEINLVERDAVDKLSKAFEEIKWEQNVEAEMSRREDMKATLFLEVDKNMPERLVEYFIWFKENESAMIINGEESAYGRLDEVHARTLIGLLINE